MAKFNMRTETFCMWYLTICCVGLGTDEILARPRINKVQIMSRLSPAHMKVPWLKVLSNQDPPLLYVSFLCSKNI